MAVRGHPMTHSTGTATLRARSTPPSIRRPGVFLAVLLTCWPGCRSPQSDAVSDREDCVTGTWRSHSLEIHHIDVGQADSTLIISPSGRTLLIDAGESQ